MVFSNSTVLKYSSEMNPTTLLSDFKLVCIGDLLLKPRHVTLLSALALLSGCATYSQHMAKVSNELTQGNAPEALALLNKTPAASSKQDRVLYLMERGMLKYLSQQFEDAAKDWNTAHERAEQLYTLSLSKTALSLVASENFTDYDGEDHEKILLPIFSALSYFADGSLPKAMVEIRKTYQLINRLKLDKDDSRFKIDGFPYFVSGLLYESSREWDSAIIEYKKAIERYSDSKMSNHKITLNLVADSLWRIAEFRRRDDILKFLKSRDFKKPRDTLQEINREAEVFLVIEEGQSPIKVGQNFAIQLDSSIVNIAFPQYQRISNPYLSHEVFCGNEQCGETALSSDIETLAIDALERRRLTYFAKMTARLLIKEKLRETARKHLGELGGLAVMAANFSTERADTRSWTLLPANIQIARIKVPANKSTSIRLKGRSPLQPQKWTVNLKPGAKKLLRIRYF